MDAIDFLVFLCAVLACLAIASSLIRAWINRLENKLDDALVHAAVKEALTKIIFIRVEEHANMQFAYNALTSEFLVQGKDAAELNANFGISFPKFQGVIVEPEEEPNVL